MVVLLMVLTFAAFIAADYMLNREKYRLPSPEAAEKSAPSVALVPAIQGIPVPAELHFHPGHTWAVREGHQLVRVGLDAFAGRVLPIPEKIDPPKLARWVRQGARGFTVQAGERTAEFLSPVDGEVVEVNAEVLENPALLKEDPYGRGWLFKLRAPDLAVGMRNLMDGSLARQWMEDSLTRLRLFFAPAALATAQDGGPVVDAVAAHLDETGWRRFTAEFFRS
jgi:glycine cleavage system H lipoate-binding protein